MRRRSRRGFRKAIKNSKRKNRRIGSYTTARGGIRL